MARIIQIGPGGGMPSNPARGPEDAPPRRVINGIDTAMRSPTIDADRGSGAASIVFAADERRVSGIVSNQSGATIYLGTAATDDSEWLPLADGAVYQHDSQSILLAVADPADTPLSGVHTASDRT